MDFLVYILLLMLGGVFAGLMAGLLGVGGGVVLTPIQYYLLLYSGVDSSIAMTVSFATSLAVIFVTMIRSTHKHYVNGFVVVEYLPYIMSFGFIGACIGAFISVGVDVAILKVLFGCMCLFTVINMIFVSYPENSDNISSNKYGYIFLGLIGGLLCGLLGVGGGIIMIPILTLVLGYPVHEAVGTSSASIIATSLGGLIAYIVLGWNITALPMFSIGYVNIIQFFFLTIASVFVAGFAANWSGRINESVLKFFHIVLVLFIGIKMIGFI